MIPLLEALKKVEQAKHHAETPEKGMGIARPSAVIIAALTVTAAAGIVSYFWPQIKPTAPLSLASASVPPPVPATVAIKPEQLSRAVAAEASRTEDARAASQAALPAKPIYVTAAKAKIDPALLRGYEAYMAGDLAAAREAYEPLLAQEAKNIDALHGMAAISLRQGKSAAAEEYYLRALEVDPKDALAQSGLISLKGQGDPLQSESRLKSLLAAQPGLFFLNFALGNLYAGQGRWSEAQQAYFKAVSSDPDNPDGLFNLAVGLDQLHQPKLAANYYQRALAAAAGRPAGFDKAQVSARLVELQ